MNSPPSVRPVRVLTLDHPDRPGAIAHVLGKSIRTLEALQATTPQHAVGILECERLNGAVIYVRDEVTKALANRAIECGVPVVVTTGTDEDPDRLSQSIPGAAAILKTPPLDGARIARIFREHMETH